ncbi:MAG: hypothetical protein RBG13Loki_2545 [Promethearchaeota archaeon CR_4]|nr:MAG: hypothetical protein RBG13Loki_2545 [Candidatus Lokiarchaeota archaeon CR_4]
MNFSLKNLELNENCIEIKKKGAVYWRIYLYRANITDIQIIPSISSLMIEICERIQVSKEHFFFSIEVDQNSVVFAFLTSGCESGPNIQQMNFETMCEKGLGCKIDKLRNEGIEKCFWGRFYNNISFSNIKCGEIYYEFSIKKRINYNSLYSIKKIEVLNDILDLIKGLKLKDYRLFFKQNLKIESKMEIKLCVESETVDKIQEFFTIISKNFSRDAISIYLPNKLLFIQLLFKFLNPSKIKIKPNRINPFVQSQKKFLTNYGFQETRPQVFIHEEYLILVFFLKKINLRMIKYYLNTYYQKYLLVFWILNSKLFTILQKRTKLSTLKGCKIQNKKNELSFWEDVLKGSSENT